MSCLMNLVNWIELCVSVSQCLPMVSRWILPSLKKRSSEIYIYSQECGVRWRRRRGTINKYITCSAEYPECNYLRRGSSEGVWWERNKLSPYAFHGGTNIMFKRATKGDIRTIYWPLTQYCPWSTEIHSLGSSGWSVGGCGAFPAVTELSRGLNMNFDIFCFSRVYIIYQKQPLRS